MKRTVFRSLALAALAAAAMIAAACGSSDSGSSTSATTSGGAAVATEEVQAAATRNADLPGAPFEAAALRERPGRGVRVAYVTCTLPQCGARDAEVPARRLGWDLSIVPFDIAKGPTDWVRAFRQATNSGVDYIIYGSAFEPGALRASIAEAKERGIRVISFGYPGPPSSDGVDASLAGPPYFQELGRMAAIGAIADAGGSADIVYASDPSVPSFQEALTGVREAVAEYGSPDTRLSVAQFSFAAAQAQNVASIVNYLRRNPDARYLISPTSAAMSGVPQGLRQAGLGDRVRIIVIEPQAPDFPAIERGDLFAGAVGENHVLLYRAHDAIARMETGEELGRDISYPAGWARFVTADNLDRTERTDAGDVVPHGYAEAYARAWKLEE